jgi:short subunit dehydrogenase-like uncharacterized protein
MAPRIILLGATGYTGARTAEALAGRGARPVLAGRDPDRLGALAERLGGLDTARADVTEPASVRALLEPGDVLVSTVGPFQRLGQPAVDAAIDAGAVYLDSTGEPPFLRRVFEEAGPRAEKSGATLLPAFGHDYVPGQLAGAVALAEATRPPRRVDVGYALDGTSGQAFSRGTLVSLLGVLTERGFSYRSGKLRGEASGARTWRFTAAGRRRVGLSVGGSEHLTLPGLAPSVDDVGVYLAWFGSMTTPASLFAPLVAFAGSLPGARRGTDRLATAVGRRVAAEPSEATVAQARTSIVAEARDRAGAVVGRVELAGPEPYAMTADLLAWGATTAAAGGVQGTGALGPVAAFGLEELAAGAASAGLHRV